MTLVNHALADRLGLSNIWRNLFRNENIDHVTRGLGHHAFLCDNLADRYSALQFSSFFLEPKMGIIVALHLQLSLLQDKESLNGN
jgi:hypothetical protein